MWRLSHAARGQPARAPWTRLSFAALLSGALALAGADHARADDARPEVASGPNALPAVDTVPVLTQTYAEFAANATLGYAFTEGVIDGEDTHHRVGTQLALGYTPLPWLGLGARLDGRLDAHQGASGGDDGVVLQSLLVARGGLPLTPELRAGAELGLRFPGASDPGRGFAATSGDLRALLTYAPTRARLWLSSALGFRLDRARHGVEDTGRLSLSDRVALGASDSNALLLGLAVSRSFGVFDVIGEWSWDLQVGSAAPDAIESPMRFSAGARIFPARSMHAQVLAGVSPSARPELAAGGPLYAIEPRLWIAAAIGLYFGNRTPSAKRAPVTPPVPAPAPVLGGLHGRVLDAAASAPLPGATLELAGRAPLTADDQGRFTIADLPAGETELRVTAAGFHAATARATVVAGSTSELSIALERELPEGQIRGTVRSFDGKPLPARIHVAPLGTSVQSDTAGNFELDVAPGEYEVVISATGYRTQKRPALVEHNGVTVIIVELSAAP